MRIGLNLSIASTRGGGTPAATTSSISPTSATQFDEATEITVTGANFTALSVAYVDGAAQATTFDSATQVRFTLPRGASSSAVLANSGAKSITVDSSNAQTFTVNAWTFSDATGLTALMDPADYNSATGAWVDTGGSSRDASQVTAGKRPGKTNVAAMSNQPMLDFDGTEKWLTWALWTNLVTAGAWTILAVTYLDAVSTNDAVNPYNNVAVIGGTAANWGITMRSASSGLAQTYNFGATNIFAEAAAAVGSGHVLTSSRGGGDIRMQVDFDAAVSAVSGNTTDTGVEIGRLFAASYLDGYLGHIVAYNADLSAANKARARNKLRSLYFA